MNNHLMSKAYVINKANDIVKTFEDFPADIWIKTINDMLTLMCDCRNAKS